MGFGRLVYSIHFQFIVFSTYSVFIEMEFHRKLRHICIQSREGGFIPLKNDSSHHLFIGGAFSQVRWETQHPYFTDEETEALVCQGHSGSGCNIRGLRPEFV